MPPDPCLYLRGLLLRGWRETGEGEEKVKGKEEERWREGFGPPETFGVAPPMHDVSTLWLLCVEWDDDGIGVSWSFCNLGFSGLL